jgi:hypothetical protein
MGGVVNAYNDTDTNGDMILDFGFPGNLRFEI